MPALVDELLDILQRHPLVKSLRIVNYDVTPAGRLELKVRCRLVKGYKFQVWLHQDPDFQDYAYQFFMGHPVLRWDNSPHYPRISTAPHHFHDEAGQVRASPLSGKPPRDLRIVMGKIEEWFAQHAQDGR